MNKFPRSSISKEIFRTLGQLKRDTNTRNEPNIDSLYKPIERKERVFRPLQVPTQLQQDLPFHLKPKSTESLTVKDPIQENQRVAVVLEPQEKKVRQIFLSFLRNRISFFVFHSDK